MSQSNILADFRPALIEAARSEEKLLNDPPREGPYPTFHHCGFAGLTTYLGVRGFVEFELLGAPDRAGRVCAGDLRVLERS